ncbi:apoptosis-antagonizing transcription factor [Sphaerosporella brunnea]|uniref:Protein BFR2 n=1 Tax=Sphaerosporella brunnea TaxID=1250544 RepID=A0A5J5EQ94_9PEZI|nr:apoptosis-antagonizing transcription factor [Sphaerosporella brunnea]
MAPKKSLTLNEQLALLNDPAPHDFDPEGLEDEFSDDNHSAGSGSGDEDEDIGADKAREHYVAVGKSALRAQSSAQLGREYEGAKVSREALYESESESDSEGDEGGVSIEDLEDGDVRFGSGDEEIESEDALGSDGERFKEWRFMGSRTTEGGRPPMSGEGVAGESSEEEGTEEGEEGSEEGEEGSEEEEDEESEEEDDEQHATLSKMMAQEKKAITENITKAAQIDAEKGAAVRLQQKTFDSFLSARIKLQKALTAINSLPTSIPTTSDTQESWKAAEASAIKLWNTLYSLRIDITTARQPNLKKRKAEEIDEETSIDQIWNKMAKLEAEVTPWREGVLEKWSSKTQTVTTASIGKKLNNTAPRSVTASIRESLATDRERLIGRTRVPRSCAPLQAAKEVEHDPEIFDDTDLYQQLLRALVDQRMVESSAGGAVRWTNAMRDAKKKKKVDTKASKGRKLRYNVHEKLQNFMAPLDNNAWHDSQISELFSSLLGQRLRVDESEDEQEDQEMQDVIPEDGLRLFR